MAISLETLLLAKKIGGGDGGGSGGGGTSNYEELSHKPQINSVTLEGNKNAEQLGLVGDAEFEELSNDRYKAHATDTVSGAIASFPDGADDIPVKSLVVDIEPVQDLNGYDNPWPAGGGKNLLPPIETVTKNGITLTNDNGKYTLSGTATAIVFFDAVLPTTLSAGSYYWQLWNETTQSGITCYLLLETGSTSLTTNVAKNKSEANLSYGITAFRLRVDAGTTLSNYTLSPTLVTGSTPLTAFAPYSNICPISGHDTVTVTRTGKNLLPNISGARAEGSFFIGQSDNSTYPTRLKAGVTYAISFTANPQQALAYMKENGGRNTLFGASGGTYTPISDMDVQMWVYDPGLTSVSNFQLELDSTATDYEPYQGDIYNIDFPSEAGTVYGGTLDVTNGVLTVDREIVDLGTVGWERNTSYRNAFFATTSLPRRKPASQMISEIYPLYSVAMGLSNAGVSLPNKQFAGHVNTPMVFVRDDSYEDAASFKTAMSGVYLCYELATPIVYDLTPTEVTTLLAHNNIWADTGDSTVEYRADTTLYVDKKIASIPNASGVSF